MVSTYVITTPGRLDLWISPDAWPLGSRVSTAVVWCMRLKRVIQGQGREYNSGYQMAPRGVRKDKKPQENKKVLFSFHAPSCLWDKLVGVNFLYLLIRDTARDPFHSWRRVPSLWASLPSWLSSRFPLDWLTDAYPAQICNDFFLGYCSAALYTSNFILITYTRHKTISFFISLNWTCSETLITTERRTTPSYYLPTNFNLSYAVHSGLRHCRFG